MKRAMIERVMRNRWAVSAFTATLASVTMGCGNLVDPGNGASHVAYSPEAEVATFLPRALLVLDGRLDRITRRVFYPEPEASVSGSDWQTLSANGRVAAAALGLGAFLQYRLSVFRAPSGEPLMTVDFEAPGTFILSPDGSFLAVAAHQGGEWTGEGANRRFSGSTPVLRVYATDSGALRWQLSSGRSSKIAFAPDGGRLFAVWSEEGGTTRLQAWDSATGAPSFEVDPGFGIGTLTATPDGRHLLCSVALESGANLPERRDGKHGFALFRTTDGTLDHTVPQPDEFHNTNHVAVSPDGDLWAANTLRYPLIPGQGTLQVWKRDGQGNMALLYAFDKELFSLAFSPDGQSIATVDLDHAVSIYRAADGQRQARRDFSAELF